MSRLPYPEEISLADALAFDAFTPEQRRIAIAGVALHRHLEERIAEEIASATSDGFDVGYAKRTQELDEPLHLILDRLSLLRQQIATADTRYLELGEIIADLTKLVVGHG